MRDGLSCGHMASTPQRKSGRCRDHAHIIGVMVRGLARCCFLVVSHRRRLCRGWSFDRPCCTLARELLGAALGFASTSNRSEEGKDQRRGEREAVPDEGAGCWAHSACPFIAGSDPSLKLPFGVRQPPAVLCAFYRDHSRPSADEDKHSWRCPTVIKPSTRAVYSLEYGRSGREELLRGRRRKECDLLPRPAPLG